MTVQSILCTVHAQRAIVVEDQAIEEEEAAYSGRALAVFDARITTAVLLAAVRPLDPGASPLPQTVVKASARLRAKALTKVMALELELRRRQDEARIVDDRLGPSI